MAPGAQCPGALSMQGRLHPGALLPPVPGGAGPLREPGEPDPRRGPQDREYRHITPPWSEAARQVAWPWGAKTNVDPLCPHRPSLSCPRRSPSRCLSGLSDGVGRQEGWWEFLSVLLPVFQNFSGPDYPSIRPPILILSVRRWPGVTEQQVYREFQSLCKFDVRRLTRNQFLLLTNKFKE